MILGPSGDIWTTNDVGMLKGLVQSGVSLGPWKEQLRRNPFDVKRAYVASHATRQLLPQTVLGRPPLPPPCSGAEHQTRGQALTLIFDRARRLESKLRPDPEVWASSLSLGERG